MKAMLLRTLAEITPSSNPLEPADIDRPSPRADELLLRIKACGVCHTELDEIEGRLPPSQLPIIPGHQAIAEVVDAGATATGSQVGDRVGVGWIHRSDGTALENLSDAFVATGCDVNGGYAEYMTVPERYAIAIPDAFTDTEAAPLLCAGAIGHRSLKLAGIENGSPLGLSGFGGSAHLVLQLAQFCFPDSRIYVFARSRATQAFARDLGAHWAGDHTDAAPEKMQAIIDTTPAWSPVVQALDNLAPGGRLVINAIRKETGDQSALLQLSYHHHLWMEREIKSVANITHADICEFMPLAVDANIRPQTEVYPLQEANQAIRALKFGNTLGAKVLVTAFA